MFEVTGIQPSNNGKSGDKMENNKYNKRRRSYTEFRESYSDNKKYFLSVRKTGRWQVFVKYLVIALIFIAVVLASFLITDALLEISEEPYVPTTTSAEETTTMHDHGDQVTVPADEVDDIQNNNDISE